MDATLFEIAESPAAFIVPPHPGVVCEQGYVVSQLARSTGAVQRIRLAAAGLDEARERVRQVASERGWSEVTWWVSELTTPPDLGTRLALERRETVAALALRRAPESSPRIRVSRVENLEQFRVAQRIDTLAHGGKLPADDSVYAETWERLRDTFLLWLAHDGGEPVAMARAGAADGALMLIGGATLPHARGRGAYRALVAARWEEAVRLGTPALVVQANASSEPILSRLGFDRLGAITLWLDRL